MLSTDNKTASARRAAFNVDVDGLYLYDRIHGHAGGSGNPQGFDPALQLPTVWTRGVVRFLDLFARTGVKATFFVVAQDLGHPEIRAVLADCVAAGHEIGSHTFSHPYNLSRMPAENMRVELDEARDRLAQATGQPIVGFRAPGYVLSEPLLEAIAAAGHTYDSSRFPCPAYQGAKAAVIGWYRLRGRPSGSIPEPPAVWFGRTRPHPVALASGCRLLEYPVGVVPGVRWPLIGTSLIVGGRAGWAAIAPLVARASWLNVECHGIDLTDHHGDAIPPRLAVQPDQRVPLARKWPLFVRVVESIAASHDVRTLASWAAHDEAAGLADSA